MTDLMQLWDGLFSSDDKNEYLLYLCCAMLLLIQDTILTNEFADNVKLLQNYPDDVDVAFIIAKADEIEAAVLPLAIV